jgi:hypothetical protein
MTMHAEVRPARLGVLDRLGLARDPWLLVPFVAGATSIASLLGYFYGFFSMTDGVVWVLLPGVVVAGAFIVTARRTGRQELADRALAGLFAGGFATLAYDVCRIPLVHSGLPIFKAISYFGTLIVGSSAVTIEAEIAGWAYHYSNGIGFALMYAALFARERLWTAIAWGTALEGAMLLTPYAEVFGYTRGRQFLAITLGAHFVYGIGLWVGLRLWHAHWLRPSLAKLLAGFVLPALGVGLVGADFHRVHAAKLPASPPPRMGPHLYVTWNVLEVDRLITLWLIQRFHDPDARFALLPPFTKTPYGTPVDVPESEIRRSNTASAAEVALDRLGLRRDPALVRLAAVATFYEIYPWATPPGDARIGAELRDAASACGETPGDACLERLFVRIDDWYGAQRQPR